MYSQALTSGNGRDDLQGFLHETDNQSVAEEQKGRAEYSARPFANLKNGCCLLPLAVCRPLIAVHDQVVAVRNLARQLDDGPEVGPGRRSSPAPLLSRAE